MTTVFLPQLINHSDIAQNLNIEALKEWGRILLLMGAYMGGFFLLLVLVMWVKQFID